MRNRLTLSYYAIFGEFGRFGNWEMLSRIQNIPRAILTFLTSLIIHENNTKEIIAVTRVYMR